MITAVCCAKYIPEMLTFSLWELSGFTTCAFDSSDLEGKLISDSYRFMTFILRPECHT